MWWPLCAALGVAKTDGAYIVLNAAGDGLSQFLPLILAITAKQTVQDESVHFGYRVCSGLSKYRS